MEVEGGGGTKQSSSFADLPKELVFAILKWVPATSLLRLRCVCKRWNSVIDDDDFVAAHHEIAMTADPGFMFSHYDYYPRASPSFYSCCSHNGGPHYESRDLTMNQIMEKAGGGGGHAGITATIEVSFTKLPLLQRWNTPSTFLFSTCRGLALYARESENEEVFEINFFVFNPVTGEEVELPPLLLPPAPPRPLPNEVTAQSNYVLGFDGRSGVYKVLVLDSRRPSVDEIAYKQCFVHTVGTDQCWRSVHLENPDAIWFAFYQREAALNGCLHWICGGTGNILSFDLHEEMFFNSLHAEKPAKPVKQSLWGLKVLGQSLAATRSWGRYDRANRREKPEQCFDIWVLEDETTNTWSDYPSEIIFPNTYDYIRIQGSWEDNHLMAAIYDNSFLEQGMIAYNVKTGACTNFYHMPGDVRVLPHHPSLVSPKKLSVLQNTKYLKFEEKSKARKWTMEPPSSPVIEEECLSFDFDLSSLFG